ncbi:MAG: polysaccharide deacetylase family protein, partial [Burkholderiales bacterium]
ALHQTVSRDGSLQAVKLHKRIGEDLDALAEIERNYEKEIGQIFSRFDARAIAQKRERWEDYVARLQQIYSRDQVLKDHGVVLPYPAAKAVPKAEAQDDSEIYGNKLAPKTVVLTFDDGPHRRYTEEIAAILKQYGVPAIFFEVGRNLGTTDGTHKATLAANAQISRQLRASGFEIANHSYSHAQLSKQTGAALVAEILSTDALLKAVDAQRSPLFRFPYGARNSEGLQAVAAAQLRSVMWNIDSLDWADPVPSSIADRVLRTLEKERRGIILFHDIHERTVKALPLVLDRLVADGYQFAGWDGGGFTVAKGAAAPAAKSIVTTGYADSWAIVIGVNDYANWPKLQHAVQDAKAIRQILIEKFAFTPERVISLTDRDATRSGILAAFHERLGHGGLKKNDRVVVFFAGHGATRKLSSGRDLGYLIPADSDPNQIATDAIPMTEIQNIAESLPAKHVLFIMDACYSGLGLTRGAGSGAFARENAKRIGRQMLTAGGADQLVADGGPNGHSIFTWTLLQALAGKADLNGDRLITGTELAAYVAPAVAGVSQQTPAFGSLPGSEGGEFIFELPGENEFLDAASAQLSGDAIALNSKLDAMQPIPVAAAPGEVQSATTVTVLDLQGNERRIVTPPAAPISARQLAQRANDRGLQFYKEQRYAEAETQFTEALKIRTDFALAANNLGFVYYKQAKYAEAARWFENTIKLDPSRVVAYANLGDALQKLSRPAEARNAFQRIVEIAPGSRSAEHAAAKLRELGHIEAK